MHDLRNFRELHDGCDLYDLYDLYDLCDLYDLYDRYDWYDLCDSYDMYALYEVRLTWYVICSHDFVCHVSCFCCFAYARRSLVCGSGVRRPAVLLPTRDLHNLRGLYQGGN